MVYRIEFEVFSCTTKREAIRTFEKIGLNNYEFIDVKNVLCGVVTISTEEDFETKVQAIIPSDVLGYKRLK